MGDQQEDRCACLDRLVDEACVERGYVEEGDLDALVEKLVYSSHILSPPVLLYQIAKKTIADLHTFGRSET